MGINKKISRAEAQRTQRRFIKNSARDYLLLFVLIAADLPFDPNISGMLTHSSGSGFKENKPGIVIERRH
jgi:hypothetical protein